MVVINGVDAESSVTIKGGSVNDLFLIFRGGGRDISFAPPSRILVERMRNRALRASKFLPGDLSEEELLEALTLYDEGRFNVTANTVPATVMNERFRKIFRNGVLIEEVLIPPVTLMKEPRNPEVLTCTERSDTGELVNLVFLNIDVVFLRELKDALTAFL